MDKNTLAVGLDIGTTKIVAIMGRRNEFGKIEVKAIGSSASQGVKRGVVHNLISCTQSIQKAIEEVESLSGEKITNVVVGIAGQHIRSIHQNESITRDESMRVIELSDIRELKEQVLKMVMRPGEQIIHVLPQEFKIDDEEDVQEPVGMYGRRIEANFHIVAGQSSAIYTIARCVKSTGIEPKEVYLEPLASASAVLDDDERDTGVALVDIGGGTTDIAIFKGGLIRHTSVIPYGGNLITEMIKETIMITQKQAEGLKLKFGSVWPEENKTTDIVSIKSKRSREPKEVSLRTLSTVINRFMTQIINLVHNDIKQFQERNERSQLISGIVLTGGGSQIRHLRQLVEYITGLDTRIGVPSEHLASDSDEVLSSPIFSTSVGLLMRAIERNELAEKKAKAEEIARAMQEELMVKERVNQEKSELIASEVSEKDLKKDKKEVDESESGSSSVFGKLQDSFRNVFQSFLDDLE